MNIIFKKIYIFDILTKKAFVTSFEKGVNVVTSSSIDGTDRGKSVRTPLKTFATKSRPRRL